VEEIQEPPFPNPVFPTVTEDIIEIPSTEEIIRFPNPYTQIYSQINPVILDIPPSYISKQKINYDYSPKFKKRVKNVVVSNDDMVKSIIRNYFRAKAIEYQSFWQ